MSSERSHFLAIRREALQARCAVQRIHLRDETRQLEAKLAGVDRAIDVVRRIAKQPLLIAAGVALLAIVGPRRIVRWAGRGAIFVTTGKRVLRLMRQ
ncbi:MAG TPA: YqjK family protein [Steroidobacteraceae bacterium]|jgi:hypothetical protein